jgi:hypothetical protein
MPTKIKVHYKLLDDNILAVYDVPVNNGTVEVHLRAVTRADRLNISLIPKDDLNYNEKYLAFVITKWGVRGASPEEFRDGITSLELLQPQYEEATNVLVRLYREIFFREYEFIECE